MACSLRSGNRSAAPPFGLSSGGKMSDSKYAQISNIYDSGSWSKLMTRRQGL